MCKACDLRANALLKQSQNDFDPAVHFAAAAADGKFDDGMWLTGHKLVPAQLNALILTPDVPAGTASNDSIATTTATLTVGAPAVVSTTNTVGDLDFYKVELVAGKTYEIHMYAKDGGPNLVPHGDAFVEVYGPDGKLIVTGDGGAGTVRNNVNSGFDVLLSFTPEQSGTFYVNARGFDQDGTNGTNGDFVGDYEIFVKEGNAFTYKPYYNVDNPLYALDWGTQVDGSSRNPDGAEGPRPTGNAFTGHAYNPYGITGKNVIYYYFAKQGEVFVSENPASPGLENMVAAGFRDWEKRAYEQALDEYEKVADLVYIEVQDRNEADFIFITYDGTPNVGVLGRMSPPDTQNEGQTEFNRNGPGWNETALKPGGFSFQTLMHELGHGHGLAHPHDNGGRSGVMRGVVEEATFDYSTGDFNLNQGIHTIMSYEDGWRPKTEGKNDTNGDGAADTEGLRPDGHGAPPTSSSYGWVATLSPFDIAVIQDKYGVNEEWATGNDTYVLKDANVDGTFYAAIWDAGGTDSIVYNGARSATIDLRAATLRYEFGGGGFVSYALGIHGGFTIANGVTIENARGGSGNDTITGNAANNILLGGGGSDVIIGGGGVDQTTYDGLYRLYDKVFTTASAAISGGKEGGSDTLSQVEYAQFRDGTLILDNDNVAAGFFRLHKLAFGERPDLRTFDSAVDRIEDQGGSLDAEAQRIFKSAEFQARAGSFSNEQFVDFLYFSLGRPADVPGRAAWLNALNNGFSRAEALNSFAQSPEFKGSMADEFQAVGFFNTNDSFQSIVLLYDAAFNREADETGLIAWSDALDKGTFDLKKIASFFANSPEFRAATEGMNNEQLVDFMYQNALDRGPDPAGKAAWLNALNNGFAVSDMLVAFSESPEHVSLLETSILGGVDFNF